jgi:transposase
MVLSSERGGAVVLAARVRAATAACGSCGVFSGQVHGRYVRRLSDLPVGGGRLVMELEVRRFRCANAGCAATTFAEQITGLTRPFARRTVPLQRALAAIALAVAGRAGVRLAGRLGITVGRDTLLRLIRAVPDEPAVPVRVLGVDDFAVRRGHRYGTIMIDLETHRPVDLVERRDGDTLACWLAARPADPEVICRDRAGGYADGARQGAPRAVQVADRFHLWQNLGQAVEKDIAAACGALATALAARAQAAHDTRTPPVVEQRELKVVTRTRQHHAAVQRLLRQGLSKAAIGRELGLHPATVRKFADTETVDSLITKNQNRSSILDGYHDHLHQRWNEGIRNATQLTREIAQLGYPGTEQQVQRYVRRFRTGPGQIAVPAPRPPSVRDMTRWIMSHPDNLADEDGTALRRVRRLSKDLDRLTDHVRGFAVMMTELAGDRLLDWISTVENDSLTALASFARNLRRDLEAVRNGLSLPYSSGAVEGHVNRVKMLKRQMFGRANFDLLRKRTLLPN